MQLLPGENALEQTFVQWCVMLLSITVNGIRTRSGNCPAEIKSGVMNISGISSKLLHLLSATPGLVTSTPAQNA